MTVSESCVVTKSELFAALRSNKKTYKVMHSIFFIRIDFLLVKFLLESILLKYNAVRIDSHHSLKQEKINFLG